MASKKQIDKWEAESVKYSDNPEYKELYVRYRTIAKQADQRLVRLESYSHDEHYHNILKYAYATAMKDIKSYNKTGNRYNTAPPKNIKQLRKKINDIEKFLEMPTSSKQGILRTYKNRASTLNTNFKSDFTWEDLANYWEGVKDGRFTYDPQEFKSMISVKNKRKKNPNLIEDIKAGADKNVKASDDETLDEIAKELLKKGITPESYFGLKQSKK